jgi:hypothetical protein
MEIFCRPFSFSFCGLFSNFLFCLLSLHHIQFRESNTDRTASSTSGRSVKVSAKCAHYDVVEGQSGDSDSITFVNGTQRKTLFNLQVRTTHYPIQPHSPATLIVNSAPHQELREYPAIRSPITHALARIDPITFQRLEQHAVKFRSLTRLRAPMRPCRCHSVPRCQ